MLFGKVIGEADVRRKGLRLEIICDAVNTIMRYYGVRIPK